MAAAEASVPLARSIVAAAPTGTPLPRSLFGSGSADEHRTTVRDSHADLVTQ
ncbi:hypothetical protein [Streptomyces sp. SH5]|uniref:hypothetical protein n=1 Tax=Streptomyces TaxID=1883 RepID=UPI002477EB7D|nr:hypothetical protein [Streptomyces sp. SH5]WGP08744.1 hypothetical protein QFA72_03200 [Streptomyces sp. SH5]